MAFGVLSIDSVRLSNRLPTGVGYKKKKCIVKSGKDKFTIE